MYCDQCSIYPQASPYPIDSWDRKRKRTISFPFLIVLFDHLRYDSQDEVKNYLSYSFECVDPFHLRIQNYRICSMT